MTGHGLTAAGVADAEAFLARLVRLEPTGLVRLRPSAAGRAAPALSEAGGVALWARLPWDVLVTRTVAGARPDDATVGAADLLAELAGGGAGLPARRDAQWRWALPPGPGVPMETLPAATVRQVAAAAERTARSAAAGAVGGGRVLGERMLRDALLDHVPIVVRAGDESTGQPGAGGVVQVGVTQRLVQAVVRMGFLGRTAVHVLVAGRFVGLAAQYGIAWHQQAATLPIRAIG